MSIRNKNCLLNEGDHELKDFPKARRERKRCTRGKKNPHLPELRPNLVTALAGLYVDDFTVMTIRKKERMQYQSSEMEQGNGDTQRDTQRKKM